jgi:hypothetical protein
MIYQASPSFSLTVSVRIRRIPGALARVAAIDSGACRMLLRRWCTDSRSNKEYQCAFQQVTSRSWQDGSLHYGRRKAA